MINQIPLNSYPLNLHYEDIPLYQLKELNGVIDEFKKETDDKHEVKVSLTFETSQSTLHLKRIRKPYLTLVAKNGEEIKKKKKVK